MTEYDLIILGGGCAGLSLATRLCDFGSAAPMTLVLDKRTCYENDRTWCFWELPGAEALSLVEHRWNRFRVSTNQASVSSDCSNTPYCAISAARFYQHSLDTLNASPRVSLRSGVTVHGEVSPAGDRWVVRTDTGTLCARSVVDTRPRREPQTGDAVLWQSFLGAEVSFASPCLDSDEVTLMDFRQCPEGRILFTYILPFSSTHGLVEVTEFSPLAAPPGTLKPLLANALQELTGGLPHKTHRTEAGMLPMGMPILAANAGAPGKSGGCYVQAGVAAGGGRAATGYAFQRIQRWATLCTRALMEGAPPIAHPADPLIPALLDHLFLRVLRQHPQQAPALFAQLFASAPTPSVIRFLSDQAGVGDFVNVVSALPPGIFLKELFALCSGRAAEWRESLVS